MSLVALRLLCTAVGCAAVAAHQCSALHTQHTFAAYSHTLSHRRILTGVRCVRKYHA
eukprot:COSAG05_NODE_358_length_10812_cov_90.986372_2_plen_57_part_00